MDEARLVVPQGAGFRTVAVTRFPFRLGRHHENELVMEEGDVSRHHAEIVKEGDRYILSDTNSRFGTFLNGVKVEREPLVHGDQIQLVSASHPALEFQLVSAEMSTGSHAIVGGEVIGTMIGGGAAALAAQAVGSASATRAPRKRGPMDLLGQALRAMVEGRVLEEVLAIVVDHAIELAGADRGFVMLANDQGALEVKMARSRNRQTLVGRHDDLSKSVPRRVFETGKLVYENDVPSDRHVPVSQPSPVVSFTTVCVAITMVPPRRGSELVAVPRQVAFVMRNVSPPVVQVRLCERTWFAPNAVETSDVWGRGWTAAAAPTRTKSPTTLSQKAVLIRRMPLLPLSWSPGKISLRREDFGCSS
jgi:hypothetical protein